MMARFYCYNDLSEFKNRIHNVHSNLCTKYYPDKKKFCGNYCSRRIDRFNRRCWRHPLVNQGGIARPKVVLLMVSASERFYNRDKWITFLMKCEERNVPIELVIYHEDMWNCTVRHSQNLVSRFRPFPDIFGSKVLPLRRAHGSLNFSQIHIKLLEYGTKLPNAARCISITERTIPIRSPKTVYKTFMRSKCHVDVSYNVKYGKEPEGVPGPAIGRDKGFAAANNHAQGLFTVEFLNVAIPTVPRHCQRFGFTRGRDGVYTITDNNLFEEWRRFTGSNPSEFWLINSFLLQQVEIHGTNNHMKELQKYMEKTVEADKYSVAEIPQWRDEYKRTFVFRNKNKKEKIQWYDNRTKRYYQGIDITKGVSLKDVVRFLRGTKKKAMFFRQVELP